MGEVKVPAQAYYGAIRLVLGEEAFTAMDGVAQQQAVDQALETDRVVRNAIAENSLNPQNIEAVIRKGLLPKLYSMVGLEHAKLRLTLFECANKHVVHVLRLEG